MIFDLKTYMKLKEQIKEKKENQSSYGLDSMISQTEELLSNTKLTITLDEMRELQEQAKQRRKNPMIDTEFAFEFNKPDEIMVLTDEAKEAKEILSKAELTITLDEMRKLKKQAQQREENYSMFPTPEAIEAEAILSKAKLTITLDEMKKLQQQAEEKEANQTYEFPTESGGRDDSMVSTEKAKEAKEILSKAEFSITLDEMKELQGQAKEILSKSILTITLDEMRKLQEKAKEKEANQTYEFPTESGGRDDSMVPTAEAQKAKEILALPNLTIAERPIRENNYTISTKSIGAATRNVSPIDKQEVANKERSENTKGQEIGGE